MLVNGNPTSCILPSRGLRQGNSLSPYLFLLCGEGLTALIRKAKVDGMIRGITTGKGDPCVSHLLFAYDGLLFCRA